MAKSDLLTEILIRSIKIADIGYIYSLLGLVGIGIATGLNTLYGSFNKASEDNKSVFQVVIEIILMLWLNGIMVYVFLNIFELVPSPFHGLYGYDHGKTFKSYAQVPLAIALFWFQTYLLQKMQYYKDRVMPSGSAASPIPLGRPSTPPGKTTTPTGPMGPMSSQSTTSGPMGPQLPGPPQLPDGPMGPQPPQLPDGPMGPQLPGPPQLPGGPMGPQPPQLPGSPMGTSLPIGPQPSQLPGPPMGPQPPQLPGPPMGPQPPQLPGPPMGPMGPQPPQIPGPPMGPQSPQIPVNPQPPQLPGPPQLLGPTQQPGPNRLSQPLMNEPIGPTPYQPTPQFMPNVSTFTPTPR